MFVHLGVEFFGSLRVVGRADLPERTPWPSDEKPLVALSLTSTTKRANPLALTGPRAAWNHDTRYTHRPRLAGCTSKSVRPESGTHEYRPVG